MRPLLALLLLALAACARVPGAEAYLARAHALHRQADAAQAAHQPAQAQAALEQLVELAPPASLEEDERLTVQRDARARLASVLLAQGQPQPAYAQAQAGLALGGPDDVFAAALLEAHGRAAEALGRDAEAVADYHRALRIDEALLGADGGAP